VLIYGTKCINYMLKNLTLLQSAFENVTVGLLKCKKKKKKNVCTLSLHTLEFPLHTLKIMVYYFFPPVMPFNIFFIPQHIFFDCNEHFM